VISPVATYRGHAAREPGRVLSRGFGCGTFMNAFPILKYGLLVVATCMPISLSGQQHPLLINVDGRHTTSLDGVWRTIVDPYENGYFDYRRKPLANGFGMDKDLVDKSLLQEYDLQLTKHCPFQATGIHKG